MEISFASKLLTLSNSVSASIFNTLRPGKINRRSWIVDNSFFVSNDAEWENMLEKSGDLEFLSSTFGTMFSSNLYSVLIFSFNLVDRSYDADIYLSEFLHFRSVTYLSSSISFLNLRRNLFLWSIKLLVSWYHTLLSFSSLSSFLSKRTSSPHYFHPHSASLSEKNSKRNNCHWIQLMMVIILMTATAT